MADVDSDNEGDTNPHPLDATANLLNPTPQANPTITELCAGGIFSRPYPLPFYPPHQGYSSSPGGNRHLFHCETLEVISSGQIFTVTTTNPVTHPLPSEELLKMQWHLSLIASMRDSNLDYDGDSIAVTSGSRSPAKEAHVFPVKFLLTSPGGSPRKHASTLPENTPFRFPTRSPPPSRAHDLPTMDEASSEYLDE